MDEKIYRIVITGTTPGNSPQQVAANLGHLFKTDTSKFQSLMTGDNITITNKADRKKADSYKAALEKVGCKVLITPVSTQSSTVPAIKSSAKHAGLICPKCGYVQKPTDMQSESVCPKCGIVYSKFVKAPNKKNAKRMRKKSMFPPLGRMILTLMGGGIGGALLAFLVSAFFDLSGNVLFIIYIVFAIGMVGTINKAWDAIEKEGSEKKDDKSDNVDDIEKKSNGHGGIILLVGMGILLICSIGLGYVLHWVYAYKWWITIIGSLVFFFVISFIFVFISLSFLDFDGEGENKGK